MKLLNGPLLVIELLSYVQWVGKPGGNFLYGQQSAKLLLFLLIFPISHLIFLRFDRTTRLTARSIKIPHLRNECLTIIDYNNNFLLYTRANTVSFTFAFHSHKRTFSQFLIYKNLFIKYVITITTPQLMT